MPTVNSPSPAELPSPRALRLASAIAMVVALVLAVTVVLPAERGIDPTGIGQLLDLTEMGRIRMVNADKRAAHDAGLLGLAESTVRARQGVLVAMETTKPAPVFADTLETVGDASQRETRLMLRPDETREVELLMHGGDRVSYRWSTDGPKMPWLLRGDTVNVPAGTYYHNYGMGVASADEGAIVATVAGLHGWFWRNLAHETVTITLRTSGGYTSLIEFAR